MYNFIHTFIVCMILIYNLISWVLVHFIKKIFLNLTDETCVEGIQNQITKRNHRILDIFSPHHWSRMKFTFQISVWSPQRICLLSLKESAGVSQQLFLYISVNSGDFVVIERTKCVIISLHKILSTYHSQLSKNWHTGLMHKMECIRSQKIVHPFDSMFSHC